MKVHVIPSEWLEKEQLECFELDMHEAQLCLEDIEQRFPVTEQPSAEEVAMTVMKRLGGESVSKQSLESVAIISQLILEAGFIIVKK
jgi:hypothetical protein